jgi:N-acetylglutamate synthase-like GNAT family acetyltransferase
VKIRRASPDDASALTQIAHDAKRFWGYPEHWIQHWQSELTVSPEYVANNDVFVSEEEGESLGFYALVRHEQKAELDHLWVKPSRIGSGVGKQLFIHAMQTAAGEHVSELEIVADPNAEGFYRKMGAYRIGETVSEIDGKPRTLPRMKIDST